MKTFKSIIVMLLVVGTTLGCSGGGSSSSSSTPPSIPTIVADNPTPGSTPFISFVKVHGTGLVNVKQVNYSIRSKPSNLSTPVAVSYSFDYLVRRGYATASARTVTLPVFGLYARYDNTVDITVMFNDGTSVTLPINIATGTPSGPSEFIYRKPSILNARHAGDGLGFNYFYIESLLGPPVVVDTDGEVRWVGPGTMNSQSSYFVDNGFVVGSSSTDILYRFELDGTPPSASTLVSFDPTIQYHNFHHSIDPGKVGLFIDLSGYVNGQYEDEHLLAETASNDTSQVILNWNFASILTQYMQSHGDDPTLFVRTNNDWFHLNSALYDPADDSILVSSRENFVIKIDYKTGNVIWIFGDPTKYWYTFPSLRAKSITLTGNGFYPIGQHALSFTSDGLLLMFNNGFGAMDPPTGASPGTSRNFSSVSAYAIDDINKTASEVWRFDNNESIDSQVCGSAAQTVNGSTLVSYADVPYRGNLNAYAQVVGLDSNHKIVFAFQYLNRFMCSTSWAARPVAFEAMSFN